MKRLFALLFLAAPLAFAQTPATRVDIPLLTAGPNVPFSGGPLPQTLWVANAQAYVCAHPSASLSACQNSPITTYTDATEGTPCNSATPLVQLPGNTCTASTGSAATIGLWYNGGLFDYWLVTTYGTYGPFSYSSVVGGTFCLLTGCTMTGPLLGPSISTSVQPNINPVAFGADGAAARRQSVQYTSGSATVYVPSGNFTNAMVGWGLMAFDSAPFGSGNITATACSYTVTSPATGTPSAVASGTVVITATNSYLSTEHVLMSGFTGDCSPLNGKVISVGISGLSNSAFQGTFANPTNFSATDAGVGTRVKDVLTTIASVVDTTHVIATVAPTVTSSASVGSQSPSVGWFPDQAAALTAAWAQACNTAYFPVGTVGLRDPEVHFPQGEYHIMSTVTFNCGNTTGVPGSAGVRIVWDGPAGGNSTSTAASFTATGLGTVLTVTGTTGTILTANNILVGTGIPTGTAIIAQVSGTPGGDGVYTTSQNTTASAASVVQHPFVVAIRRASTGAGNNVMRDVEFYYDSPYYAPDVQLQWDQTVDQTTTFDGVHTKGSMFAGIWLTKGIVANLKWMRLRFDEVCGDGIRITQGSGINREEAEFNNSTMDFGAAIDVATGCKAGSLLGFDNSVGLARWGIFHVSGWRIEDQSATKFDTVTTPGAMLARFISNNAGNYSWYVPQFSLENLTFNHLSSDTVYFMSSDDTSGFNNPIGHFSNIAWSSVTGAYMSANGLSNSGQPVQIVPAFANGDNFIENFQYGPIEANMKTWQGNLPHNKLPNTTFAYGAADYTLGTGVTVQTTGCDGLGNPCLSVAGTGVAFLSNTTSTVTTNVPTTIGTTYTFGANFDCTNITLGIISMFVINGGVTVYASCSGAGASVATSQNSFTATATTVQVGFSYRGSTATNGLTVTISAPFLYTGASGGPYQANFPSITDATIPAAALPVANGTTKGIGTGDNSTIVCTTGVCVSSPVAQFVAYSSCTGAANSAGNMSFPLLGSSSATSNNCVSASGSTGGVVVPVAGTVKLLTLRCGTSGSGAGSGVVTLFVAPNGNTSSSTTGITVTYGTTTAGTAVQDVTHTYAASVGDRLSLIMTGAGVGESLAGCSVSFVY